MRLARTGDAAGEASRARGLAAAGLANRGLANRGLANRGLANRGLANCGLAKRGLAKRGLANCGAGLANRGLALAAKRGLPKRGDEFMADTSTFRSDGKVERPTHNYGKSAAGLGRAGVGECSAAGRPSKSQAREPA
jgi:hypothetical protein